MRFEGSIADRPDGAPLAAFLLLWLAGLSLRMTVLAVPPVIHLIRSGLGLSGTEVGLLVTLPTLLFAAVALPGAVLVSRIGAVPTLVAGLFVTGAGAAARAVAPGFSTLLLATAAMGAGIAVMQPTLPALVRRWLPERIGLGTAVYSNGLLVGEILPVSLTNRLVLPAVHGSWGASLAAWSVPILATALLVAFAAPAVDRAPGRPDSIVIARARPRWDSPATWLLGAMFGTINVTYFATNAFLPAYLTSRGAADLIPAALTALNAGQLPAAFLMIAKAGRWQRRARPFYATGLLCLAGIAGIVASSRLGVVASAGVLGFGVSSAMVLALTLPALLFPPEHVAATSAAMFTISYGGGIVASVAGGAAWDLAGDPIWAFTPVALCSTALAVTARALRRRGDLR